MTLVSCYNWPLIRLIGKYFSKFWFVYLESEIIIFWNLTLKIEQRSSNKEITEREWLSKNWRRVLSSSHLIVFHYITIESKNSKGYWSKSQFNQIRLFSSLKFIPIPPCKYEYYWTTVEMNTIKTMWQKHLQAEDRNWEIYFKETRRTQ